MFEFSKKHFQVLEIDITEPQSFSWLVFVFPLIMIQMYLWGAYLVYRFGPWVYPFREDNRTFLFILAFNIMLLIGYTLAMLHCKKEDSSIAMDMPKKYISPDFLLAVCCVVGLFTYMPTSILYTGYMFPPVFEAIRDPFSNYIAMMARVGQRQEALFTNALSLFRIFDLSIPPLVFYFRERLNKYALSAGVVLSLVYWLIYVSSSRNMPLFWMCMSISCCFAVKFLGKKYANRKSELLIDAGIIFAVLSLTAGMFVWNLASRTHHTIGIEQRIADITPPENVRPGGLRPGGAHMNEILQLDEGAIVFYDLVISSHQQEIAMQVNQIFPIYAMLGSFTHIDLDDRILFSLPHRLRFPYLMATGYLTNGFHGLTVAMRLPHQWTYGLGHSIFLSSYAERILGVNILERSYISRAKQPGIAYNHHLSIVPPHTWGTSFVQLADDLTFPGTVVFAFVIGYFIMKLWKDSLHGKDPASILLMYTCVIGIMFLPANLILTISGGYFVNFYGLLFLWISMKVIKKRQWRKCG